MGVQHLLHWSLISVFWTVLKDWAQFSMRKRRAFSLEGAAGCRVRRRNTINNIQVNYITAGMKLCETIMQVTVCK